MIRNILTLDIEDWYQSSLALLDVADRGPVPPTERVVTNTRHLLHILAEYGVHATCFVLGAVAETYPDLVREIHASRHEIATHGYGHDLVYKLRPEEFRADVRRSLELLENILGEKVRGYRAPYFSITRASEWALEVIAECGIEYDSSIFPIRRKLYGFAGRESFPHNIPTAVRDLCEFPISTVSLMGQELPIGGGGYFRLLPYSLIRQAIRAINRQGQPAVFYLHPYELDVEELRNPLPGETWKTCFVRLSQGLNREMTEAKLRRLLVDFEWTSVTEWMAEARCVTTFPRYATP